MRFELQKPDRRPAVDFDNVADAAVNGMSVKGDILGKSLVRINNARDVLFTGTRILSTTNAFLELVGINNSAITVEGGDISRAAKSIIGPSPKVVRLKT